MELVARDIRNGQSSRVSCGINDVVTLFPRSHGRAEDETLSENADQVRGEAEQPPMRADGSPKKSAAVVHAVVVEEQRQMEMDFVGELLTINPTKEVDVDQVRAAMDGLDELETALKSEPRYGMAVR